MNHVVLIRTDFPRLPEDDDQNYRTVQLCDRHLDGDGFTIVEQIAETEGECQYCADKAKDAYASTYNAAYDAEEQGRDCTCVLNGEDDPDCELHHPEVIETESSRATALRWWLAGHNAALANNT